LQEALQQILTVKTAVSLGQHMYQTSLKINGSLAFTNNMKGVHKFTIYLLIRIIEGLGKPNILNIIYFTNKSQFILIEF